MTGLDGTPDRASVVALHCSLGSGRQWEKLAAALGGYRFLAPDISGYGMRACGRDWPRTLDGEITRLDAELRAVEGPIHMVGHSYGGAIAFRMATASPYAHRIRSLTLIEPVLPTLLREGLPRHRAACGNDPAGKSPHTFPDCTVRDDPADARLYERFAHIAQIVSKDIFEGAVMEAVEAFTAFWAGSGPGEQFSPSGQLRMIEQADKLACDFAAILALDGVAMAAADLRVPTLLFSGGMSPYVTQRIVAKLASIIDGAGLRHLPAAGHMLPVTHAEQVNREIVRHIMRVDEPATSPAGSAAPHLVFRRPSFWE
ncbi:alpha/beta fold hydrolase [Bradyrhizobium sp. Arg68]|uniref:alpha/beta fold hydrolase n=1 Tax=Bradyrhizobium ivorense TaxID=2511166 RepID=UPI001E34C3F5|nr:alpha/beta fold hydrolase [Bradyrhizobium ivorense]MCC8942098.1 alpha/beta fold hydrolase [Bradyrhizobium ivorense]